jgi:hypothetical protein
MGFASDMETETRPAACRFRLMDEGQPYPRSSCTACGRTVTTGLGNQCAGDAADARTATALAAAVLDRISTQVMPQALAALAASPDGVTLKFQMTRDGELTCEPVQILHPRDTGQPR